MLHLSKDGMLEVEVHEAGRELGADQGGQVHLVALEHVLDVAGLPLSDDPIEKNMVDDNFQERERERERIYASTATFQPSARINIYNIFVQDQCFIFNLE